MNKIKFFLAATLGLLMASPLIAAQSSDGQESWTYSVGRGSVLSSPVLSPDGSEVAVGSYDHKLHVMEFTNGRKLWSYDTGKDIITSPAYSPDGKVVYVADKRGTLYALSAPTNGSDVGELLWEYDFGNGRYSRYSSPTVGSDGTIYIAYRDIYAISPSGELLWKYKTAYNMATLALGRNEWGDLSNYFQEASCHIFAN